jgi:hypothetical protein
VITDRVARSTANTVRGHASPHDWRIVAPWYRWALADGSEPERAANATRPAFHKFVTTDFITDFLDDPQRSVVFDEAHDVLQRIDVIPSSELEDEEGRRRSIATRRSVPTQSRKLFLAAHQRFYLVAIGLHCERPGFPMVDPAHVADVGFVIRRRRATVPDALVPQGRALVHELNAARATARVRFQLDSAQQRSRLLHPFRATDRARVVSPRAATVAAAKEVELARRRLQTWAAVNSIEHRTEGWVATGEGSFGTWVPMPDAPEELIERSYPMRHLRAAPGDPDHAAHDGTIYYAVVPTASDEVTERGVNRFNELDTYEIAVHARPDQGACPGRLTWSEPSRTFRLASFFDPAGSAQRPIEIRLPDFAELEASGAMPSVRMTAPPDSSLDFSKFGEIPTAGRRGAGEEICFFSIPLITIIAMFVLNLFLPVVMFVFQLWWMLKLKFCIPPSIEFEADLALELDVEPPELEFMADIDIDVIPGTDPAAIADVLKNIFNPPPNPPFDPDDPDHTRPLDPVPADWQVGEHLLGDPLFTNNALFQLALRNGYGKAADAAPDYTSTLVYTTPVRREEVVHP